MDPGHKARDDKVIALHLQRHCSHTSARDACRLRYSTERIRLAAGAMSGAR